MKKILKYTLLSAFALVTQNSIWGNLDFDFGAITVIKVAIILSIFEILIKPIVKLLLLPINLLTLGLFRIVINTVGFYLAVFLLADFHLNSIVTTATNIQQIAIPALSFSGFWAFVVNSTTQNIILSFFKNIIKQPKEHK